MSAVEASFAKRGHTTVITKTGEGMQRVDRISQPTKCLRWRVLKASIEQAA